MTTHVDSCLNDLLNDLDEIDDHVKKRYVNDALCGSKISRPWEIYKYIISDFSIAYSGHVHSHLQSFR